MLSSNNLGQVVHTYILLFSVDKQYKLVLVKGNPIRKLRTKMEELHETYHRKCAVNSGKLHQNCACVLPYNFDTATEGTRPIHTESINVYLPTVVCFFVE